ncbi:hypothetical protein KI387_015173, partial [Taxus chinensis]
WKTYTHIIPGGIRHRRSGSLGKSEVVHRKAPAGMGAFLENKGFKLRWEKYKPQEGWEFYTCLAG